MYEEKQKSYYLNEINRALPGLRGPLDAQAIELALGGSDAPSVPATVDRLVSDFGADSPAHQRDAACRAIRDPSTMRPNADDRTGCGWYFRPNALTPSTGAYGTRRGPMNPTLESAGAGTWIWNPEDAASEEGTKQTSRIATCPDIAYSQYPNVGWCTSTNRALVHNGRGQPRFPRAPGGDCPDGTIITRAADCPPPPSQQQSQATAGLPPSIAERCTPKADGSLSPACIQAMVQQVCSPAGLLSQSLAGSSYAAESQEFNAVNSALTRRGFELPAGILRDGKIGTQAVLSSVQMLKEIAGRGNGQRDTSAASRMCYGTPFDPCEYTDNESGPFDSYCITKQALRQGYSPQGHLLPGKIGDAYWRQFPNWGNVRENLKWWKSTADAPQPNPRDQATGIYNVYGMTVKYPPQGCNTFGILMYRYYFPPTWDWSLFPQKGPQTHFLGRYVMKNGLPNRGSTWEDQTPAGGFLTEAQRMVTNFFPQRSGNYQFLIQCDDWVRMSINDKQFAEIPCCGVQTPTPIIPMIAGQIYKLTWDFVNGGGPWSFSCLMTYDASTWTPIPKEQMFMTADRRLPMIELPFNKLQDTTSTTMRSITDSNAIFTNLQINAPIGSMEGVKCMIVGDGQGVYNYETFAQGVRLRAMKSITMKVYVASAKLGVTTPALFSLYNTQASSTQGTPRKGAPRESINFKDYKDYFQITTNGSTLFVWGAEAANPKVNASISENIWGGVSQPPLHPINQWFHLALVWDDDFKGYAVYIDGKLVQRGILKDTFSTNLILEQFRIGCDATEDGTRWTGGMAWFHAFDYRLNDDQIKMDMNDNWVSLV